MCYLGTASGASTHVNYERDCEHPQTVAAVG